MLHMPHNLIGTKFFGLVDRVPGACFVATLFVHLSGIPIWPRGSFLLSDDSAEKGRIDPSGGAKPGSILYLREIEPNAAETLSVPLPTSLWSVFIGYARGWLGAVAVVTTALIAPVVPVWLGWVAFADLSKGLYFSTALGAALLTIIAVGLPGRHATFLALLLAGSGTVAYFLALDRMAAGPLAAQPLANQMSGLQIVPWSVGSLLAARATWLFSTANYERARELLLRLGWSPERIESWL